MFVFPFVRGPRVGRVGKKRFEELYGNYRPAFIFDGRGGQKSDVFKAFHMGEIALPERHEKAYALCLRKLAASDSISS